MEVLKFPSLDFCNDVLSSAINSGGCCIIGGDCRVWYSGRAESFLEFGERVLFLKSDGTVLVHQRDGGVPVNWMPSGSVSQCFIRNFRLVVLSTLPKDGQRLKIEFDHVNFLDSFSLVDSVTLVSAGSEKDMAMMLYNNPELVEPGFKPISLEEQTAFGFIDVFGYDKDNFLVVVECKRYSAGLDAVTQLRRYVEKVKSMKGVQNVRGLIAAPKITPNALKMLEGWGFGFRKVDPPKFFEDIKKKQTTLKSFG